MGFYERCKALLPWLVSLWFMGLFVLSLRLMGGWVYIQYIKKWKTKRVPRIWDEQLTRLSRQLQIRRSVRLLESALIEVPTVIGWLRPVILMPIWTLTGLSPQQIEAILVHELVHIRRYDYLVNLMQTLLETLLFYHPATWWISHRIRVEREYCCDDVTVAFCGDALTYTRALTEMEERRGPPLRLAVAASAHPLLGRIRRLVETPSSPRVGSGWNLSGMVVFVPFLLLMSLLLLFPQKGYSAKDSINKTLFVET